ncbi:MAG TPA: family 1 glycosylhydrolase [Myxococcales bacterium]|nr:family 1 glycosylhydrolase [Myxococcales bacterium]
MILTFPRGFAWGTSTSAHQVEGKNENNDWAEWERRPGAITDGTRAGDACGWWNGRAEQDLSAAAAMGQNAHRLSLEWSRLEPEPGRWDDAAFARYARLLDEMRRLGLDAMVTLQHVTLPLWVARRGSWTWWEVVDFFGRYAEECARRLHGRVRSWVTMNEPAAVAGAAYALEYWPPALGSSRAALRALAVMLEAHAAAYHAIKRVEPDTPVGVVLSAPRLEPAGPALPDRAVAWAQDWAFLGATLRALRTGSLLFPLRGRRARVPGLRGSADFLGVNYYGRYAVRFDPKSALLFGRHVQEPTVRTGKCDWGAISPDGLTRQLVRLARFGVPLYVTENGIRDAEDSIRPKFLADHVAAVHEAIRLGADVRGYFHWSLVDNFEWAEGWAPRFGLYALDPVTQHRTPRQSAALYAEICRTNSVAVS